MWITFAESELSDICGNAIDSRQGIAVSRYHNFNNRLFTLTPFSWGCESLSLLLRNIAGLANRDN